MADQNDTTKTTKDDWRPSAVICRERGWDTGTRLVGDEGHGPTVIQITAVGEESILAKTISENGKKRRSDEMCWSLSCRDWKVSQ